MYNQFLLAKKINDSYKSAKRLWKSEFESNIESYLKVIKGIREKENIGVLEVAYKMISEYEGESAGYFQWKVLAAVGHLIETEQ